MIIGFTGTRHGMTLAQARTVAAVLAMHAPVEVHHGCCKGADAEFHRACVGYAPKARRHGWPGPLGVWRADIDDLDFEHPWMQYAERNQAIVNACDLLIAAPVSDANFRCGGGGGTWQTIRRARLAGKPVVIVWPDGRKEEWP
jgi:hypothetical protein